jgi:hypothetical protein
MSPSSPLRDQNPEGGIKRLLGGVLVKSLEDATNCVLKTIFSDAHEIDHPGAEIHEPTVGGSSGVLTHNGE